MCWHKPGVWKTETRLTGGISLRLSDGMIMTHTWTERTSRCLKCNVVLVDESESSSPSQDEPVETGTKININQLLKNAKLRGVKT